MTITRKKKKDTKVETPAPGESTSQETKAEEAKQDEQQLTESTEAEELDWESMYSKVIEIKEEKKSEEIPKIEQAAPLKGQEAGAAKIDKKPEGAKIINREKT